MPTADIASLADIIRVHGAERPDAIALHVGDRTVTFAELDARSSQVANAFQAAGVISGDRVAFIEKNGAEFFEVTFGLAKLGAVNVAVNWRLAPPEMPQIIEDAGAEVVIVGSEFFGHIETIEDRLTKVRTIVAVGAHDRWPAFDDWVAGQSADDPGVATGPDDVAFQLYTSGTTGLPKGVMLTNDNFFGVIAEVADNCAVHRRRREPRDDADVPHRRRRLGDGRPVLRLPRTSCCATSTRRRSCRPSREHRITNAFMVPAVIQFLLVTPGVEDTDFSSLRSHRLRRVADHRRRARQGRWNVRLRVHPGLRADRDHRRHHAARRRRPRPGKRPHLLRSCGKPYPWVEVRIVDTAPARTCPVGAGRRALDPLARRT